MRLIDFDGTLLDPWQRFYSVFCKLLGINNLTISEYKGIKKELKKDGLLAEKLGKSLPKSYFEDKAEMLESKELLKLDKLYFGLKETKNLFQNDTFLFTKRRNPQNLKWQLRRLGLDIPVIVVKDGSKFDWINENITDKKVTVIGDSVQDLKTAEINGVNAVMVGYGLGNKEQFDSLGIDYKYFNYPDELYKFLIGE